MIKNPHSKFSISLTPHNTATPRCLLACLPSSQVYKWKFHRLDRRSRSFPGQGFLQLHLIRLTRLPRCLSPGLIRCALTFPHKYCGGCRDRFQYNSSSPPNYSVVYNYSWNQEPVCYFQFGCRFSGGKVLCISNLWNPGFNSEPAANPDSDLNRGSLSFSD